MKLLFDQNLSFRLATRLADIFAGSDQVRNCGLDQANDAVIWEHAKSAGFTIVSQDADFAEMPKVIWLRESSDGRNRAAAARECRVDRRVRE